MAFVLTVLGVVLILEGLPYFVFPARLKAWAQAMQDLPERSLRIMGLLTVVAGFVILYAVRYL
ncbi:MAG: DUF2065 domain-containing protein [Thermodesulfobacteriota bacterium]